MDKNEPMPVQKYNIDLQVSTMTNKEKANMHKNQATYGHKCIIDMQVSSWDEKKI